MEDDFTSGSGSISTAGSHSSPLYPDMNNPQSGASYAPGHGPSSFYPTPQHAAGQPGFPGYPGPMSPYPGSPMSPYTNQNHNNGVQYSATAGNQNVSPLYNQNQSSYPGYQTSSSGSQPGYPGYYNNQSPTHAHQYQAYAGQPVAAGQPSPVRLSPPPMGMMGLGARIPHPNINSPNQNLAGGGSATPGNKTTENIDLKPGSAAMFGATAAVSQGYSGSGAAGYGYNGFTGQHPTRPLVSPLSPHGRLNISPGGPSMSPRDGPPNMSPHPSLYSQHSPGPSSGQTTTYHGSYQAQYSEYFAKQSGHGHSPGGYQPGLKTEEAGGQTQYQGEDRSDKLSDAQSNTGSVRSADPGDQETGETSITNLQSVKKTETAVASDTEKQSSDSDIDNKFTPKSESEDGVKTEPGSYFEEHKDFTLKANQTLIDGMNIDNIPELPEIPELKYEDVSEMNRIHQQDNDKEGAKEPGLSPDMKDGGAMGRSWEEAGEEDGFRDMSGGWGGHMQPGRIRKIHIFILRDCQHDDFLQIILSTFEIIHSLLLLITCKWLQVRGSLLEICNSCVSTNYKEHSLMISFKQIVVTRCLGWKCRRRMLSGAILQNVKSPFDGLISWTNQTIQAWHYLPAILCLRVSLLRLIQQFYF